jgi:hypothetical protein
MNEVSALDLKLDLDEVIEERFDFDDMASADDTFDELEREISQVGFCLEFFARWEQERKTPPTAQHSFPHGIEQAKRLIERLWDVDLSDPAEIGIAVTETAKLRRHLRLLQWEFMCYAGLLRQPDGTNRRQIRIRRAEATSVNVRGRSVRLRSQPKTQEIKKS